MSGPRHPLTIFTPLPPERNGIADYAATLLGGLAAHYDCAAACEDWLAEAPQGVPVLDPALAHRRIGAGGRVLHQLGNNPGHGFVLRALRLSPGVTTLHDPGLLHLHETAGESRETILAGMMHAAPARLAETYARHLRRHGITTRANHLLFDLAGEVLARSRAVVVHSRFAAGRLRAMHGAEATAHVAVIPHLLPPLSVPAREAARARLGIPQDAFLICTAGFATRAKRLDWVIEALDLACAEGVAPLWIHAGAERAEEFPLSARIAERPALRGRARVAGWLTEAALTAHIAACDVLVNLRFPSSGESSGSLARAFAAAVCCIVSDTGAYAELPRGAVLHLPLAGAAPELARLLVALAADPARRAAVGEAGRRYALAEMALPTVAARYREVIEDSLSRPVASPPAGPPPLLRLEAVPGLGCDAVEAALRGIAGPCRLLLAVPDLAALADLTLDRPGLVTALLPPRARLVRARVLAEPERTGLLLDLDLGWAG
ncbi:MAG: glycosyltransferase family 4 protein [Acetobacteraceae bacterium]|nr:glycosyltransferase family 4 protein [Acetobacteraceae bacterium]